MTDDPHTPPTDTALVERFALIPARVNEDAGLLRRGRFLTAEILIGIGTVPVHLSIVAGQVAGFEVRPGLMRSWRFAIRGTGTAWSLFWRPVPPPGWHDLFALSKRGELTMEGDLQPFVANLQYIKDVLAMPRSTVEL
jgi:hypothetical protein